MAVNLCNFTITGAANGGRLTGNGFNGKPTLNNGDSLQVIVRWSGSGAPSQLNGYFIFSPVQSSSQSAPSPFLDGSNYLCYDEQTAGQDAGGPTYTFAPFTYAGSQPGSYELTFVAEDNSAAPAPPRQWSEDPEFDTGS